MSLVLRIILILASVGTCFYISRKLKKAQVDTHDTIFWLLFSCILILVSIFPKDADWMAQRLGIYSTVNMVFLLIIFALLLRVFQLTIKSSQMEHKIRILVEELAIRDKAVQVSEEKILEGQKKERVWVKPEMKICYFHTSGSGCDRENPENKYYSES